ncbi:hypothetical protein [Nonomuraea sp. NPDC050310]|uniref:hypothetical protein n=1 Tax=Nonomuraea sp. NPDC050310 TaxID=3154935 RepID=UPI0033D53E73
MSETNLAVVIAGAVVVIAIAAMAGYAAIRLASTAPRVLVGALLALAVILGAIPAILIALQPA